MIRFIVGPKAPDNEKFGHFLRVLRERSHLSRRTAAERLGFTSEYLRLIERGKRTPALGNMPMIAEIYGKTALISGNRAQMGDFTIEFTSRILETRGRRLRDNVGRTERIGQIVQNLDGADDETLEKIYSLLRRKRDTR